jgi:hypothetical protein
METNEEGELYHGPKKPRDFSVAIDNRYRGEKLTLESHLQIAYSDLNDYVLINPSSPRDPDESLLNSDPTDDVANDIILDAGDLTETDAQTYLAAGVKATLRSSDRLRFVASVSIDHQRLPYALELPDYEFLDARIGAGSYFVNRVPTDDVQKTRSISIGGRYEFRSGLTVSLIGFDRDRKEQAYIFHQTAVPTAYDYIASDNQTRSQGVALSLSGRLNRFASINLNYQYCQSEGSYWIDGMTIAWMNPGNSPGLDVPSPHDSPHKFVGALNLQSQSKLGLAGG